MATQSNSDENMAALSNQVVTPTPRSIPKLTIKTDFYGTGYIKNFYDVRLKDIELYETKKAYENRYWYIKIRGIDYAICPTFDTFSNFSPQGGSGKERAKQRIKEIEAQIDDVVNGLIGTESLAKNSDADKPPNPTVKE